MKYKLLTDICSPKQWTTISTDMFVENGLYAVYGANGIIGRYNEFNHEKPTILLTCRGATCGSLNITEGKCYVNGNAMCLDSLDKDIDLKYLYYFLNNYDMNKVISGTAQPQITINSLKKISVPVISLDKQQEIVSVLDKINAIIDADKKQLELLDATVKSRFIEMFGDPNINPKGYEIKPLSDISSYWNGLTYKPTDVVDTESEGTLVLRSSNIQEGVLAFEDNVYVNCNIKEKQFVKENDILMCSRNGSARLVGKVALIKGLTKPTSFGAFMMIIRSDYYPYLKTYFEMPAFRSQLATGTSTINQITGNMLGNVKIPVPELEKVKQFEEFITLIDKSKFNIQQHLNLMQELLDKKMEEYFGGE